MTNRQLTLREVTTSWPLICYLHSNLWTEELVVKFVFYVIPVNVLWWLNSNCVVRDWCDLNCKVDIRACQDRAKPGLPRLAAALVTILFMVSFLCTAGPFTALAQCKFPSSLFSSLSRSLACSVFFCLSLPLTSAVFFHVASCSNKHSPVGGKMTASSLKRYGGRISLCQSLFKNPRADYHWLILGHMPIPEPMAVARGMRYADWSS